MTEKEQESLTKRAYLEVAQLVSKEFDTFRSYLDQKFQTKESCEEVREKRDILSKEEISGIHKRVDTLSGKYWVVLLLCIAGIILASLALGMKMEEVFMRAIGFIK